MNPDGYYTLQARAFTLSNQGAYDRALADINKAIAAEPQRPAGYTTKSNILMKLGKSSEALAALDHGIATKSDYAQFFYDKAQIYRELGDNSFPSRRARSFTASDARRWRK